MASVRVGLNKTTWRVVTGNSARCIRHFLMVLKLPLHPTYINCCT